MTSSENNANDSILRVGMIGAGGHATHQLYPCLYALPVQLVAVCDVDETRAIRNARAFGASAVYADHTEMLRDADLDAVLVCVGPHEHPKLAIDVLESGLPVWTEKPPACSAPEARAILDASHRTGKTCMTGFMKRFSPVYKRARAAVASAEFGSPSLLTINWSFGVDDKSWLDMFLLDFGIHMIDLSRYLFGEVVEVSAQEREGIAYVISMAFTNGAVGSISMTANRGLDITEEVEITGGYGHHVRVDSQGHMLRYHGNTVVDWYQRPLALQDSLTDIGYLGELQEFVQAARDSREPESSIASAYETMRLHDAICRSLLEHRAVLIDEA